MKRYIAAILAALMLSMLAACGASRVERKKELIVFAAASLNETVTELASIYESTHPGIKITCNFDSSGTLKTQIQMDAECDVFISAGQKQMDQIDAKSSPDINTEGLDYILPGSRTDLLENMIVLVVPKGNPAGIESFDMLAERLSDGTVFMAMGNSDVPVGQYAQKILAYYGLNETALSRSLTYGSNAKEVVMQVSEAAADCGIVYSTDAFSEMLTVVDTASAEMCGRVIYPAAVLNVSKNPDEALEFLEFLKSDEAAAVFEGVGFTSVR